MTAKNYNFSVPNRLAKDAFWLAFFHTLANAFKVFIITYLTILFKKSTKPQIYIIFFILFIAVLIFLFIVHYLRYKTLTYQIIDNELIIQKGWLNRSTTIIQFNKINEVRLQQNFFHKIIELYKIEFDTAGSNKTEVILDGIEYEKAIAIKNIISQKSSDTDTTVTQHTETLKISLLTLFKIGITRNYLLYTASLVFAFFAQIDNFIPLYTSDNQYSITHFWSFIYQNGYTLTALFLLVSIAIMIGTIGTIVKYYNYTIQYQNHRLVASYGWIQSHITSILPQQIQLFIVRQNYFQKILRLFRANILQIDGIDLKKNQTGIVIPGIHKEELTKIFRLIYQQDLPSSPQFYRPSMRKFFIRSILLSCIVGTGIILSYFYTNTTAIYIAIPLYIIALLLLYMAHWQEKLWLNTDFIIIRKGIWTLDTYYLPIGKIQNIQIKQSYFQKKKNLASLVCSTASRSIAMDFYPQTIIQHIANQALYIVESKA